MFDQSRTDSSWNVCVSGVEVGTPTHFTIYTKGAGKAKPEVHFAASSPGEAVRDFEIIDNHDYSYTVKYTALQQVHETSVPLTLDLFAEIIHNKSISFLLMLIFLSG